MDVIKIPFLNPLKFHREDLGFACQNIPFMEVPAYYLQKFQTGDKLSFQILLLKNSYSSISYKILDQSFNEVAAYPGGVIGTYGENYDVWGSLETELILDGLVEGIYFISLAATTTEGEFKFISEPFEKQAAVEHSLLIEYSHDGNNFDMAFYPSGVITDKRYFQIRVEGGVMSDGVSHESKDSFYIDQVRSLVMLDSVPSNVYKFTFGPGSGLPNWMADKINRILSCAEVKINGVSYVKNEGSKLEPIREKGYPFAGWQVELIMGADLYSITEGSSEVIVGDFNNDYNEDYY